MRLIFFILCNVFIFCCYSQKRLGLDSIKNNCNSYFDTELKKNIFVTPDIRAQYFDNIEKADFTRLILKQINVESVSNIIYEQGISLQFVCSLVIDECGKPICFTINDGNEDVPEVIQLKREIREIVLNKLKKWIPARCNDKNVPSLVRFTLRVPKL